MRARGIQVALLGVCILLGGCPARAQPPNAAAPSLPHLLCEAFEADQRPFVDRLRAVVDDGSHALDALGRCWPTARGAWALSVDEKVRPDSRLARWSLVHVDEGGARAAVGPSLGFDATKNLDLAGTTIDRPAFFDFDGDGEVEIFLRVGWSPNGEEVAAAGRIWTFHAGKGIERYAPSRDLDVEALRDVDADGRPDVITYSPYVTPIGWNSSCKSARYRAHGPPFVAHSLRDGAFSRSDEVAVSEARRACTSPPKTIVALVDGTNDGMETVRNVVCARLFGETERAIDLEIDRVCGPHCDFGGTRCDDPPLWRRFAGVEPPPH